MLLPTQSAPIAVAHRRARLLWAFHVGSLSHSSLSSHGASIRLGAKAKILERRFERTPRGSRRSGETSAKNFTKAHCRLTSHWS